MIPHISMDPAHRYVTQSSAYDRLLIGAPLTDRRIRALKKLGHFASGLVLPQQANTSKPKASKRLTVTELLSRYNI